ncbi:MULTISPECIES: branched-chain amino acid ABC transporter permease [unclassified Beijerinckia]|uniref:branched-chain amino acid ABC transporter permease n=1 Tax=unclassified Beijerinckia TaxID=2638183 RepID=UPI00089487FC|nr:MULTISPECIES: branched-chain amino acid ABC transporter permease [unclassified Beijerinckia]MDH7799012.1 branched-chain amino acid transport system permease protein [Beijerinckia sp. GAS462]SED84400.1 branched-chain amino acid transport system permease protein [Beijerinckia sp. 28-YEA-48]
MNLFTQAIFSGLMTGAVYALLGVGLVLVYRTARVLNLAHGEAFAMSGILVSLLLAWSVPFPLAIIAAICIAVALAMGLHRFLLRPRGDWPPGTLILITLGAAFVARGIMILLVGTDPVSFPALIAGSPIRFAGGVITPQGILLIVFGFAAAGSVGLFLTRTAMGRQMLATAENPYAAELLGVDIERARLIAYGISGLFSALAGILLIPLFAVDFQTGLSMTMRGFIAAAISGMSPTRVLASAFILGLFESMVGAYFGALAQDPVMFAILILIALLQSRKIRFGGGVRA